MTKPKRSRDTNQLAKFITDLATGEIEERTEDGKNPAAVALGRLGGQKGGKATAGDWMRSGFRFDQDTIRYGPSRGWGA
jgi:hypothetical protein